MTKIHKRKRKITKRKILKTIQSELHIHTIHTQ